MASWKRLSAGVVTLVPLLTAVVQSDCDPNNTLWQLSDNLKSGQDRMGIYLGTFAFLSDTPALETPIVAFQAMITGLTFHDCYTFWETDTKQFFTNARPSNPATYTLSGEALDDAAQICYDLLFYMMTSYDLYSVSGGSEAAIPLLKQQGLQREIPIEDGEEYGELPSDVQDCIDDNDGDSTGTQACIDALLTDNCWSPLYVASALYYKYSELEKDDGFGMNTQGSKSFDGSECTANCLPFSNTVDYEPQNRHSSLRRSGKARVKKNGDFRIRLNKRERLWAPLLESDGNGFFFAQEHVTPHIGFTGVPAGIAESSLKSGDKCKEGQFQPAGLPKACAKVDDPKYDYGAEAEAVISLVNSIVSNTSAMAEIDLFDAKVQVTIALTAALYGSIQDFRVTQFYVGLENVAVFDAHLMVWREKVIFDLIRPTTVIQGLGDAEIQAAVWDDESPFGGEIRTIKASDWQPYKRVMPHSEYPSGSACVCKAVEGITRAFLDGTGILGEGNDLPIVWQQAPRPGRHPGAVLYYPNVEALAQACSQSRLNGGMHFSTSVPAGEELCSSIGNTVYNRYGDLMSV